MTQCGFRLTVTLVSVSLIPFGNETDDPNKEHLNVRYSQCDE
jgi:hypothetical protein